MLIVLKKSATDRQVEEITRRIRDAGLTPGLVPGARRSAITVTGNTGLSAADIDAWLLNLGVDNVGGAVSVSGNGP